MRSANGRTARSIGLGDGEPLPSICRQHDLGLIDNHLRTSSNRCQGRSGSRSLSPFGGGIGKHVGRGEEGRRQTQKEQYPYTDEQQMERPLPMVSPIAFDVVQILLDRLTNHATLEALQVGHNLSESRAARPRSVCKFSQYRGFRRDLRQYTGTDLAPRKALLSWPHDRRPTPRSPGSCGIGRTGSEGLDRATSPGEPTPSPAVATVAGSTSFESPLRSTTSIRREASAARSAGWPCRISRPALLLLPDTDRQRVQALTAYCLTLFDFVRQTGLEGERLTAINRWEFELESALDGRPPGQPVYVLMHHLEQQNPWPRECFDRLHAYARRRCAKPRPTDPRSAERHARILGETLVCLVSGNQPGETASRLAASLIRLCGLTSLGDDLRRHRAQLPITELPDSCGIDDTLQSTVIAAAVANECQRLREMTDFSENLQGQVPNSLGRAARYCQLAAGKLLERVEAAGTDLIDQPPRLSLPDRLALLLRSRWY